MSVTAQCRDINELLPAAQKACNLFLVECKKAGLDIFITETYRSQARQNYLYEQGRTRPGQKITWTKNSRHTSRLAWDVAVNKPKDLYDTATLNKAGAIAKKLGITWGGSWKGTPDMPHFEVTKDWTPPASIANQPVPKKEEESTVEYQKDAKPSPAFAEEFKEAVKAGITDGTYPQRLATREEVAVMVYRAMKNNK